MRLKMASAVEGCLYRRLKVVPGRPSRYSNDRREDADILPFETASFSSMQQVLPVHHVRCQRIMTQKGARRSGRQGISSEKEVSWRPISKINQKLWTLSYLVEYCDATFGFDKLKSERYKYKALSLYSSTF